MQESDLSQLLKGTADPAFAVTLAGTIRFWSASAEQFFGVTAASAIGSPCCELLCGQSNSGIQVCTQHCAVLERAALGQTTPAFDLEVKTHAGPRWVNVSIVLAPLRLGMCALHLLRDTHQRKQIEQLARGFLTQLSAMSGLEVEQLIVSGSAPHLDLTGQETAVLRLLVSGQNTNEISTALNVSRATVRNHIEHILRKLSAHSRVEAILRAIREKLV